MYVTTSDCQTHSQRSVPEHAGIAGKMEVPFLLAGCLVLDFTLSENYLLPPRHPHECPVETPWGMVAFPGCQSQSPQTLDFCSASKDQVCPASSPSEISTGRIKLNQNGELKPRRKVTK